MGTTVTRRPFAVGGAAALAVAAASAVLAAAGAAAPAARPRNVSPPTVSGQPVQGQVLRAERGRWSRAPSDFDVYWQRCGRNGGSCARIGGTDGRYNYRLTSADVGTTLRFRVGAANGDGRTWASSVPTAVVARAPAPAPAPAPTGCPSSLQPAAVEALAPPARLLVDGLQAEPPVVTRQTTTLLLRLHVGSTCGGSVQGALVYATATPFNQFTVPPEQPTGSDGWVELRLDRLAGFPVSRSQTLITLFVRARKPGESLLAGVSTRRLVSLRVELGR